MSEKEHRFNSFEEASQALRLELENLTHATEFPSSTFEIAKQAIELAKGDEVFEAQKGSILRDFVSVRQTLMEKYDLADDAGKAGLLEQIQRSLNDYLLRLERPKK